LRGKKNAVFTQRYGPWALIAGASKGIGAAFAEELASRGVHLVLVARKRADLEKFAKAVSVRFGVTTVTVVQDLAASEAARRLMRELKRREIGLVVYNAALSFHGSFSDGTLDEQEELFTVNCRTPLALLRDAASRMTGRGRGGVILMSSLAGLQGGPFLSQYAASKAFLTALAEGLWYEYRPKGVHILACIAGATATPGFLETQLKRGMNRLVPVSRPRAVAKAALAALGKKGSVVSGGWNKLGAFFMSRFLSRRARVRLMGSLMRKE